MAKCNQENNFLLYPSQGNSSNKNILFLGSCRMSPLMYYWKILYPDYNIYNIYIPYWTDRSLLDKKRMQSILKDVSLIITETVKNYGILNTHREIPGNFFESFDTKAQEIRISNLELHMYTHDLHNIYNVKDSVKKTEEFEKSKTRLKNSLTSKEQSFIWKFIEDHIKDIRLFATHNHPTKILSLASFIHITRKLQCDIDMSYIAKVIDKTFLQGHYTPILQSDIDIYNFKFNCPIFPDSLIEDSAYRYNPSEEEIYIPIEIAEKLLSYI